MGKQQTIDEQAKTPAQGAEGSAETPKVVQTEQFDLGSHIAKLLETYEAVLVSNAAVMESNEKLAEQNQLVIGSLDAFKENSTDFVKQLVDEFSVKGSVQSSGDQPVLTVNKAIDEDAQYIVAEGKSFRDSKDFTKEYKEGEDVTHLGNERLQPLLNQGLIEEA